MVSRALDVLSVDEMKMELRIPSEVIDHDQLIERHISSAVAEITGYLHRPIVDTTKWTAAAKPSMIMNPVAWIGYPTRSVGSIHYWLPGQTSAENPNGHLSFQDLGRSLRGRTRWQHFRYPPSTGWPTTAPNSPLVIEYIDGLHIDSHNFMIKQAIVLLCRSFYDGSQMKNLEHSSRAAYNLVRSLKREPVSFVETMTLGIAPDSDGARLRWGDGSLIEWGDDIPIDWPGFAHA